MRKRLELAALGAHFRSSTDISLPSNAEVTPAAIAQYVRMLPPKHEHYADALMIAQLVIHNAGVSIRGKGGIAILPSILINMAQAFEDYIRRLISEYFSRDIRISVKNGNVGGNLAQW